MTPAEITRFEYRTGLFQRRGFPFVQAAELAHELWERDADKDDRRVCVECKHFQRSRTCAKREMFLITTLQRCPQFAWQTPA